MSSPTDPPELEQELALSSAGKRAAQRPVVVAPPLGAISRRAQRLRNRRRVLSASATLVLLAGLAVPVNAALRTETPVQMVAAGTGSQTDDDTQATQPVAAQPPNPDGGGSPDEQAPEPDHTGEGSGDHASGVIELRLGGDVEITVIVLGGDRARDAADRAQAAAVDTLDADGTTVWVLDADEGRTTLAASIDDDGYIEVTGPSDQIDRLVEIIESGGVVVPPIPALPHLGELPDFPFDDEDWDGPSFFLDDESLERFLERWEGDGPSFFFDGEFFGPDRDFGFVFPPLGEHHGSEVFPHFDQELPELFEELAPFLERELPEMFGQFDPFLEGERPELFEDLAPFLGTELPELLDELDLCFRIELDGDESFRLEHPEGCGDG